MVWGFFFFTFDLLPLDHPPFQLGHSDRFSVFSGDDCVVRNGADQFLLDTGPNVSENVLLDVLKDWLPFSVFASTNKSPIWMLDTVTSYLT